MSDLEKVIKGLGIIKSLKQPDREFVREMLEAYEREEKMDESSIQKT